MSGPIVRRYGFPNFEKIFGERKLEHGVDEEEKSERAPQPEKELTESQPSKASEEAAAVTQMRKPK